MKNLVLAGVAICFIGLFSSCYYDKEQLLYPGNNSCDTTAAVSYAATVVPMFQSACYSCHGGSTPSGGIAMGTYAADKALAVNGKLYGSINHSAGYSPMPQGAPKFTACQIAKIKKWIDASAPNN